MTFWYILHILEQGDWALAGQMFMCNRLESAFFRPVKVPKSPPFGLVGDFPWKPIFWDSYQGSGAGSKQARCESWISGSWLFISKDYEALKTKLKGSTNLSNGFFVALKCFEMVCIKWIKCVFLPLVAFYRVWVSQRVWVDIPRWRGFNWKLALSLWRSWLDMYVSIHTGKHVCSDTG